MYWNNRIPFADLTGRTLKEIKVNDAKNEILFVDSEGVEFKMFHDQDCCESVVIEDIVGDIEDLIGAPITLAEEASNNDNPKSETYGEGDDAWTSTDESCTWTFYKLATVKGYVTIRWYGSSNGYYSESVDFVNLSLPNKEDYE